MSKNKKRKEINKAIFHLVDYIEMSDKWGPLFKELIIQLCAPVASRLGEEVDTVIDKLLSGPSSGLVFDFLLEEMATTSWDNEGITPIETFLKTRGWRVPSAGRRYLRTLQELELKFFEITHVEPGDWVEIRPFGTSESPKRVVERAASQFLHPWDGLVARTFMDGKIRKFSGGMLPLDADASAYVQHQLLSVPDDLAGWYQEMVDEGEDVEGIVVNFADGIPVERTTRLLESAFLCFALKALNPSEPVMLDDATMDPDSALQNNPQVQAMMKSHLTEHYRRTLDEAIPMLDNRTPRDCAADPKQQKKVVDWLKHLENSSAKSAGMAYDTGWMWKELGLEKYKPR